MSRIRVVAKSLLRHASVGRTAVMGARALRQHDVERRLARLCGYVPAVSRSKLPNGRYLRMDTLCGRDQVARGLYFRGWRGIEKPLPEAIVALQKEGAFIDVGANSGFYSLLVSQISPESTIIAFEPFPEALNALRRNIELNPTAAIDIREVAAGESDGVASLYLPDASHGLLETSASINPDFRDVHDGEIAIEVVTLDEMLASRPDTPVDIIKIDAEGADDAVLRGAQRVLAKFRPIIFVEILTREAGDSVSKVVEPLGYSRWRLHSSKAIRRSDWPLVGGGDEGRNQMLCPDEKAGHVLETLARAGWKIEGATGPHGLPLLEGATP